MISWKVVIVSTLFLSQTVRTVRVEDKVSGIKPESSENVKTTSEKRGYGGSQISPNYGGVGQVRSYFVLGQQSNGYGEGLKSKPLTPGKTSAAAQTPRRPLSATSYLPAPPPPPSYPSAPPPPPSYPSAPLPAGYSYAPTSPGYSPVPAQPGYLPAPAKPGYSSAPASSASFNPPSPPNYPTSTVPAGYLPRGQGYRTVVLVPVQSPRPYRGQQDFGPSYLSQLPRPTVQFPGYGAPEPQSLSKSGYKPPRTISQPLLSYSGISGSNEANDNLYGGPPEPIQGGKSQFPIRTSPNLSTSSKETKAPSTKSDYTLFTQNNNQYGRGNGPFFPRRPQFFQSSPTNSPFSSVRYRGAQRFPGIQYDDEDGNQSYSQRSPYF
ncbi:uncharacterized protein LOC143228199 [Tachypleus tridentatus]|uniref:uncharacterized protein LOC143228199 n=1 Tax=Tachypleus tridentatus TaxID=6853 RepID=UPI003FD323C8